MRCAARSSKRRPRPRDCRSSRSRFPHRVRTRSTRSGCASAVANAVAAGFTHVAFGDLFLEDVRRYREDRLAGTGLAPIFPLWGQPTADLAREMIAGGLEAVLTCVDPRVLDRSLPVGDTTRHCSTNCRPPSIPAANAASFIPSAAPVRCFVTASTSNRAWCSNATALCLRMFFRRIRRARARARGPSRRPRRRTVPGPRGPGCRSRA